MRALPAAAGAAALTATLALVPAMPSTAAGEIELSSDGVSWSTSLGQGVFDPNAKLVPGDSITGTFYVRNATGENAWLRVGLSELIATSMALALAVDVTTQAGGDVSGSSSTGMTAPGAVCTDLIGASGTIPAGGVARIDTTLAFSAAVPGTTAQNALAHLEFIVELTSAALPAPTGPLCDGSLVIDPDWTPGGSGGTGPAPPGGGTTGGGTAVVGTGLQQVLFSSATGSAGGYVGIGEDDDGRNAELLLLTNTVQWWEEYAILVLLGAALFGALARVYAHRRWGERKRTGEP